VLFNVDIINLTKRKKMNYLRGLFAFIGFALLMLSALGINPEVSKFFITHIGESFGLLILIFGILSLNFKD